jgi:hypothetical protein
VGGGIHQVMAGIHQVMAGIHQVMAGIHQVIAGCRLVLEEQKEGQRNRWVLQGEEYQNEGEAKRG